MPTATDQEPSKYTNPTPIRGYGSVTQADVAGTFLDCRQQPFDLLCGLPNSEKKNRPCFSGNEPEIFPTILKLGRCHTVVQQSGAVKNYRARKI